MVTNRKPIINFGLLGIAIVLLSSFIADRLGWELGPWWVVACLGFELLMLGLADALKRMS